ncbi:MAG: DUF1501 domain-containing protein [Gammaproteobacteria bacterium]
MLKLTRRALLSSGAHAVIGLGAGAYAGFSRAASFNDEILVYVFLRGGIDGCNVVVPLGKDHEYYTLMRPTLALPTSGTGAVLPLGNSGFGFNAAAAPLRDLYNSGHLAVVLAAGTPTSIASRSHFDAEKYIELGTPGLVNTATGWLHRHFDAMANQLNQYPPSILLPILALRSTPPASLLGNNAVLTVYSPESFRLDNAYWRWSREGAGQPDQGYMQLELLKDVYAAGSDSVTLAGRQALTAEAILFDRYNPNYTGSGTIPYPADDNFAKNLRDIAQLIKLNLGLRIATADYDGWDTHEGENDGNYFNDQVSSLSRSLAAFFDDINRTAGVADRVTVIVQSEFGRRVYEDFNRGTDHGNGNFMLALGKQVNGGKLYGVWPGLYPGEEWVNYANPKNGSFDPELFQGALNTTTDFRRALSDYLMTRYPYTASTLNYVFPGYSGFQTMGLFKANAAPGDSLFSSGFE